MNRNIDDSKKFLAAMKELVPSKGKKSKVINLVDNEGTEVAKEKVADFVNDFFHGYRTQTCRHPSRPLDL